jgi:hypothetical protein
MALVPMACVCLSGQRRSVKMKDAPRTYPGSRKTNCWNCQETNVAQEKGEQCSTDALLLRNGQAMVAREYHEKQFEVCLICE